MASPSPRAKSKWRRSGALHSALLLLDFHCTAYSKSIDLNRLHFFSASFKACAQPAPDEHQSQKPETLATLIWFCTSRINPELSAVEYKFMVNKSAFASAQFNL